MNASQCANAPAQIHGPATARPTFSCLQCSFSSSRKDNLKAHVLSVHDGVRTRKAKHVCAVCKAAFVDARDRDRHAKTAHVPGKRSIGMRAITRSRGFSRGRWAKE
jgi:hypothetical protein